MAAGESLFVEVQLIIGWMERVKRQKDTGRSWMDDTIESLTDGWMDTCECESDGWMDGCSTVESQMIRLKGVKV